MPMHTESVSRCIPTVYEMYTNYGEGYHSYGVFNSAKEAKSSADDIAINVAKSCQVDELDQETLDHYKEDLTQIYSLPVSWNNIWEEGNIKKAMVKSEDGTWGMLVHEPELETGSDTENILFYKADSDWVCMEDDVFECKHLPLKQLIGMFTAGRCIELTSDSRWKK